MAKSMLRMGSCVRFCRQHFIPSHKERQGFPLLSVLDFRCFRVIPLANHKLPIWRKNRLYHEARWFCAEKSSSSFYRKPIQRLQRLRLSPWSRSNRKRVSLSDSSLHGPFELVFMTVSAKGFALFSQQDIGQFRKELDLYHKLCIPGDKIRWKLQLVGFSYDKKSANVVMWKDKEYEYFSSAWNKPEQ